MDSVLIAFEVVLITTVVDVVEAYNTLHVLPLNKTVQPLNLLVSLNRVKAQHHVHPFRSHYNGVLNCLLLLLLLRLMLLD